MDARLTEAHHHVDVMSSLEAHAGWKMLVEILEEQSKQLSLPLVPLVSESEVYAQEFAKGEMKRIQLILALPATLIETAQSMIESLSTEEPDDGG